MAATGEAPELGEHPYVAAVEHSLDGVLLTVPDGRILAANPAACEILGATEDEIRSRGRQGFSDLNDPRWATALEERTRTGRVRAVATMIRADGTPFLAEMASTAFISPGGSARACVIFRDVTERVRLEKRLKASNEVTHALLAGEDTADVLATIARHARLLIEATTAIVVSAEEPPGSIRVVAAEGPRASNLLGRRYPPGSMLARVMAAGHSVTVEDLSAKAEFEDGRNLGLGPAMVVPIISGTEAFGNLVVGSEPGRRMYGPGDLAVVQTFADAAGVALALGKARSDAERMAVLGTQARIAADMHDSVIQRLFALGMRLQAATSLSASAMSERVEEAVETIDSVIAEIRGTIFDLKRGPANTCLTDDIQTLVADAAERLGFEPRVTVTRSHDIACSDATDQLLMVLREALSNVIRHSGASKVDVDVSIGGDLMLTVVDDGVGPPGRPTQGFGLQNMRRRAVDRGGTFLFEPNQPRGARLEWRVPVSEAGSQV